MTEIQLRQKIHLTNSKSWVTIHGLNNFHSLCERERKLLIMSFATADSVLIPEGHPLITHCHLVHYESICTLSNLTWFKTTQLGSI